MAHNNISATRQHLKRDAPSERNGTGQFAIQTTCFRNQGQRAVVPQFGFLSYLRTLRDIGATRATPASGVCSGPWCSFKLPAYARIHSQWPQVVRNASHRRGNRHTSSYIRLPLLRGSRCVPSPHRQSCRFCTLGYVAAFTFAYAILKGLPISLHCPHDTLLSGFI